jgi:ABC-type multidrug transport system ATPase subunit
MTTLLPEGPIEAGRSLGVQASAIVEVKGLTKTYPGGVKAVCGIDFSVREGEVFGLLGPNGAGKSTTIGMLTTAVSPTAGTIRLGGFDVARQPLAARRMSAVVTQDGAVDRGLSGRRNLEIHAHLWGVRHPDARISELVDSFDLGEIVDRPVSSYSGGQRRRLEIARALISEPVVLFLDEPTVGLDTRIRHELLDLIRTLTSGGTTILLTTHYLDEAERICDRVAIMHKGRIADLAPPQTLLSKLGERIVEIRVATNPDTALDTLRAASLAGADAFTVGQTITIPFHDGGVSDVVGSLSQLSLTPVEVNTRPPNLDDVYLSLTGERIG